jgi:trimeric autotransporter adhesin
MAELNHFVRGAALVALAAMVSLPAAEAVAPRNGSDPLAGKERLHAGLWLAVRNVPLADVVDRLPNRAAWESFTQARAAAGESFAVFVDPVSGTATNITRAVPLIPGPGAGNGVTVQSLGRRLGRSLKRVDAQAVGEATLALVHEQRALLGIDVAQLGAARAVQVTPDLWQVDLPQQFRGIPVRDAHVGATISHGNVVLMGAGGWSNVALPGITPTLAADTAVAHGFAYAEGRSADDEVSEPVLEIVGSGHAALVAEKSGAGAVAGGYQHRLVWTFSFRRRPSPARWEVMVDAHTGEVLSFQDLVHYAKRQVTGGVYPLTNTETCPAPGICGVMQTSWPMPFADTGFPAPHNFSNSAGIFDFVGGTGATTLSGRYITIEGHAPLSQSSAAGNIPLFGANGQHDLVSPTASAGNTAAARTAFYELNKVAEMARGYLPYSEALRGEPLRTVVNQDDYCNAYYDPGPLIGGPGSIHFFRSGSDAAMSCRNTGEIGQVLDHEWGHWFDDHDGSWGGSEATADIVSLYRNQTSCLGPGFFESNSDLCGQSPDGTGANVNMDALWGRHCTTQCSGVREADWARHEDNRPDDVFNFACSSCIAFHEGHVLISPHCLAAPVDQMAWDFVTRDLDAFPYSLDRQSAFMTGSKLFYQAGTGIRSWWTFGSYLCDEPSDGCGSDDGYMQWLAADDDNGNLNDGTPHMTALFDAFDRHGIACATPAPIRRGCLSGPGNAPNLTVTPGHYQASLSWNAVPGATRYWVFRTEGHAGCDYGKALIAEVTGTSYVDTEVATLRPYHYNVVAAGASSACYARMSNCATVTPTAGSYTVSCTPTALDIGPSGGSATTTCTARSTAGYASPVSLVCGGLPGGASCTSTPATAQLAANGTATFSVRVMALPIVAGTHSFQVRGTPSAAPLSTHSAALTLTVGGGPGLAAYDPVLRAPSCGTTIGPSCDSGASLLLGRAGIGPEPNHPNTLGATCADGPEGRSPADGSNDRIRVGTLDNQRMAADSTVRLTATVYARDAFAQDRVDFFYAADAANPSWIHIGSAVPPAAGPQTLSVTYTLPRGDRQAVRVQYRQGGQPDPCTPGLFNDRDDLVFAVAN